MSDEISIRFTRFSALYSPLIATIAGGFLQPEGFAPKHATAPAGKDMFQHSKQITKRHRYEDAATECGLGG